MLADYLNIKGLSNDRLQRLLDWYVRHEWCTKSFTVLLEEKLKRAEIE